MALAQLKTCFAVADSVLFQISFPVAPGAGRRGGLSAMIPQNLGCGRQGVKWRRREATSPIRRFNGYQLDIWFPKMPETTGHPRGIPFVVENGSVTEFRDIMNMMSSRGQQRVLRGCWGLGGDTSARLAVAWNADVVWKPGW